MTTTRQHLGTDKIKVRLAQGASEIEAAQHLRYRVFYEEYAATPDAEMAQARRDFDAFDSVADHLIVTDESLGTGVKSIVGTYRLLRQDVALRHGNFYTSSEYDISPLVTGYGGRLLELGRSCVLDGYRTRPVMQLLWKGIAEYVTEHGIDLMFGCASLHGTDVAKHSWALAYLYHHHLAPAELRPRALENRYIEMNLHQKDTIDAKTTFNALPPLFKGYLRLGAGVGDGAVIDHQFNTIDVCIVLQTSLVTNHYRKHYERSTGKAIPAPGSLFSEQDEKTARERSV